MRRRDVFRAASVVLLCSVAFAVLCSCSRTSGDASDALWLHWPLDQATDARAIDTSGNGRDGEILGARWPEGDHPYLAFQGGSDAVQLAQSETFPEEYTWTAWVAVQEAPGSRHLLASQRGEACSLSFYCNWVDGRLALILSDGQKRAGFLSDEAVGTAGDWHHVAFARSNDEIRFFIDGVIAGESATSVASCRGGSTITIGGTAADESDVDSFVGGLRDMRIYGKALTQSDIANLVSTSNSE
jgi:hypothetical protein